MYRTGILNFVKLNKEYKSANPSYQQRNILP